jgi:hypothetical protein
MKHMRLSTLNLGLWWEGDPVDVLKFLHYSMGMSETMIRNLVVSPDVCSDCPVDMPDAVECTHDWRMRNKAALGLLCF